MKIRYFDFGLFTGRELKHISDLLSNITDDFECYGFEACHNYYKNCEKILGGNKIKIIHGAISNEHNKSINLYYAKTNNLGHSIHNTKNNINTKKYEVVNSILFSTWLKENKIDLENSFNIIKINIEGAEWELINDVIDNNLNQYIHVWCGDSGNDVAKIKKFVEEKIVEKFQKLLHDNNITILRFTLGWKEYKNVDIKKIIEDKYKIFNDNK